MAREAEGGYMQWPAAPSWMEPLLAEPAGGQLTTVSRLANADLDRLLQRGGGKAGGQEGGAEGPRPPPPLKREDLRYPVAPRGKYQPARGAFPQNEGEDRLIPGDGKTVYMACGQPTKYLARRRKLPPLIADNSVLSFNYEGNEPCGAAIGVSLGAGNRTPDVSSVTGRQYSRRRMIVQPEGFFGFQGQPTSQSSKASLRRATFGEKI